MPFFGGILTFACYSACDPLGYNEAVIESLLRGAPEVLPAPERRRGWNTEDSGSGAKHTAWRSHVIDLHGTSNKRLLHGANNSTCVQAAPYSLIAVWSHFETSEQARRQNNVEILGHLSTRHAHGTFRGTVCNGPYFTPRPGVPHNHQRSSGGVV
jgi:hypothetical protein